jgi:hypothetical protein
LTNADARTGDSDSGGDRRALILIGILLVVLEANRANAIVSFSLDIADEDF